MGHVAYNFISVASLALAGFVASAVLAQAEVIRDFTVTYTILEDGVVEVEEVILYDFEEVERRGIFRSLLTAHPQGASAWYKNRFIELELQAVTRNGESVPYEVQNSRGENTIKIGDPDITLSGEQEYTIEYRLIGALSSGSDGAELYYNVTGRDWSVPILRATARVIGQPDILLGNNACYVGEPGTQSSCQIDTTDNGIILFTAETITPGEQLTIATEVNADLVTVTNTERISYLPFGFALAALWLIVLATWVYRHRHQDVLNTPIIAEYEPYGDYLPMFTGVLYDGRLDAHDITAGILYLAEQGFIRITKTDRKVLAFFNATDYEITLLKPIADIPTKFLTTLSGLLFSRSAQPSQIVMLSSLTTQQVANRQIIRSLTTAVKDDLRNSGIMKNEMPSSKFRNTVLLVTSLFFIFGYVFIDGGEVLAMIVAGATLALFVIAWADRRTTKGHKIKHHLDGFKLFLTVTDKDRFDFHNAPEKSPELFMKYLPYAVALGVEDKWAKVFAGITIPQPDWYRGGDITTFSAVALTNDIGSFSSSFTSTSGTSGSSGGGSAGGGGGGGGGGSW